MALGRVLPILFISLILRDAAALSLDLEGLKEQAATHITGQKLNEIVSTPSLLAGTPVSPGPYLRLPLEYLILTRAIVSTFSGASVFFFSTMRADQRLKLGLLCCDAV